MHMELFPMHVILKNEVILVLSLTKIGAVLDKN